jgi:hypothetical protein
VIYDQAIEDAARVAGVYSAIFVRNAILALRRRKNA